MAGFLRDGSTQRSCKPPQVKAVGHEPPHPLLGAFTEEQGQAVKTHQNEGIRAGALFKGPGRPSLLTMLRILYENAAPALNDNLPEHRQL